MANVMITGAIVVMITGAIVIKIRHHDFQEPEPSLLVATQQCGRRCEGQAGECGFGGDVQRHGGLGGGGGGRFAGGARGGRDSNFRVHLGRIVEVILFFILVRMEVRDG